MNRFRDAIRHAVIVLAVAGCIPWRHHDELLPRQSLARDSLLLADLHRVDTLMARGIAATRASYFGADIVYLRAGAPAVFGRDNVIALLASTPAAALPLAWQPLGGGIARDALSGYTFGVAIYAAPENRPPVIARYIAFWNRTRGGPWKIVAYAEVGAESPQSSPARHAGTEIPPSNFTGNARRAAAEVAAADSDFADDAAISGTGPAFEGAVAADGVIFGGPELIVGPGAIKEYFDAQRGVSISWHPVFAVAATSGDLGFSVGESVSTSRGASGAAVQRFGKYLTVWRKEPNGKWKFVVDGGSSRPSPLGP